MTEAESRTDQKGRVLTREDVACDLCGGRETVTYLEVNERIGYFKEGEVFTLRKCSGCGLIFVSPRPTREAIGAYYAGSYYAYQSDGRGEDQKTRARVERRKSEPLKKRPAFWTETRKMLKQVNVAINQWTKRRLAAHFFGYPDRSTYSEIGFLMLTERILLYLAYVRLRMFSKDIKIIPWRGTGRLLDVGSGAGTDLLALRDKGWTVKGADMSREAAETARRVHELEVVSGQLEDGLFPPQSFDVIHFGNSLEHVHSPNAVLREAHRLMAPGGLLLIKVPNAGSTEARYFGKEWFQLDVPRHLYHFTLQTLEALLERAGFRVVRETCDRGATFGIRESIRGRRIHAGRPDFENRKIFEWFFWTLNFWACLRGKGGQLVIYAEPVK